MTSSQFLAVDFEPVTGLTMRDARPFQAGESGTAHNLEFPPPPGSFALEAAKLVRSAGRRVTPRGFSLICDDEEWYPPPLDLHFYEGNWVVLAPFSPDDPVMWRKPVVASKEQTGRLVTTETMAAYLRNGLDGTAVGPDSSVSLRDIVKSEFRTGVALGGRKALPGQLYTEQISFLKRKGHFRFRLGLEVTGDEIPNQESVVKLGGESRLAHVRLSTQKGWKLDTRRHDVLASIPRRHGRLLVKLCLLTPAVFSAQMRLLQGSNAPAWRPNWMKLGLMVRPPFDAPYQVRLVAAITGKPFPLGFWDGQRQIRDSAAEGAGLGAPKPLYRCLPAGSVFYLELQPDGAEEDALEAFFKVFWLRSLLVRAAEGCSPGLTHFGKLGFGWTAIGGWNYASESR
jgi:hypothetical protein